MPIIGFDAQATQGRQSGLGVFTRSLLNALKEEIQEPVKLHVYTRKAPENANINTARRLLWENWILPQLARRDEVDILHVPAFAPPFCKPCPLVVTVHDIAGKLFKNQIGPFSAIYWGKWLPHVVKQADRIIADSKHTKKDLVEHLRMREEKIRVVYPSGHEGFLSTVPAAQIAEIKKRLNLKGPYFIFVGTMEPRKNLGRILDAFKIFQSSQQEFQLILVGSKAFAHGQYIESLAREHDLASGSVIAPGFLERDVLNALYCGAYGLLFPSLYEGFGIPILEAMASGCPVLTSMITSTPEVAGDAAILVDPYSVEAIAHAMTELADNELLRSNLRQKGFEQIQKFSWKKTAREVIDVYKEFLR